ncbi:glycerol-3-phosphate 1-O-acyltransferase PlsY [bacterium]|nr:glycerol-3-phosphate 1-O-acyltransferase PlsY [bacterium]
MTWKFFVIPLAAYFIGAIPFSYLITRWKTGGDIRNMGSGNVGATNVLRTTGKLPAMSALILDVGKGVAAVYLGRALGGNEIWGAVGGFFAVVGHSFPVFLNFRGGKSVATGVGAFLVLCPLGIISAIAVFIVMLLIFRIVSLGSITASASFPLFAWLYGAEIGIVVWGAISALWIIFRHSENVVRLLRRTERKMGERKHA